MKLLNMLTWKNLRLNRKRTTVTIIGIMLSVALLSTIMNMVASFYHMLLEYEVNYKGNYHVVYYQVPVEELPDLYNNRAIETISITQDIGYAFLPESKNDYKPYIFVKGYTRTAFENMTMRLTEGRYPENDQELLISTHMKSNGRVNYKVGDTITLQIGTRMREGQILTQDDPYAMDSGEEIVNTESKTYTIVGLAERPSSAVEGYEAPGYTCMTYLADDSYTGTVDVFCLYTEKGMKDFYRVTAGILGVDPDAFDQLCRDDGQMRGEEGSLSEEQWLELTEKVSDPKYEYWSNEYLIMLQMNPFGLNSEMSGIGLAAAIACLIIVVTSVFCIKNSFDISITEKIRQYGMLRSVGATAGQIRKNVLYEAMILGLIGIPLGLGLGFAASAILVQICNYYLRNGAIAYGMVFRFVPSWPGVGITILLGCITIILSAIRSAQRASRVAPIESIRNSGEIKLRAKKLRCPKWIIRIFGVGGELSYKNLKRNRKKYRTTILAITISVFTFVALSYFIQEMMNAARDDLQQSDYNYSVTFNLDNKEDYPQVLQATKLAGIRQYSVIRDITLYMEANELPYSAQYLDFMRQAGEILEEEEGGSYLSLYVVGNEEYQSYLKRLGLAYDDMWDKLILLDTDPHVYYMDANGNYTEYSGRVFSCDKGDIIHGYFFDKDLHQFSSLPEDEKQPQSVEIGYVTAEFPFGMSGYHYSGKEAVISDEFYDSLVEDVNWCSLQFDAENPDELQDEIDQMFADMDYRDNNIAENVRMVKNLITLIGIFLYGFIIVVTLIGVTTVFNTITTNMELRRREFAMLRSVGMTNREFSRMIYLETIFMGAKSLIFGIPIGLILCLGMYMVLELDGNMPFRPPYLAIILAIICVFLLIAGIMRYSMNRIRKQNTIDTIRNENI